MVQNPEGPRVWISDDAGSSMELEFGTEPGGTLAVPVRSIAEATRNLATPSTGELILRINVPETVPGGPPDDEPLYLANRRILVWQDEPGVITIDGTTVAVSPVQGRIMIDFANNPGQLLRYSRLYTNAWDASIEAYTSRKNQANRSLRIAILGLRRIFGDELGDAKSGVIRNEYALGYRALSTLVSRSR